LDLGQWADESYRVPVEQNTGENEMNISDNEEDDDQEKYQ
jgi:endogenous inhibitor of DNA gyrase (YacG/DUF329 family)